jgi:hypothetical protein
VSQPLPLPATEHEVKRLPRSNQQPPPPAGTTPPHGHQPTNTWPRRRQAPTARAEGSAPAKATTSAVGARPPRRRLPQSPQPCPATELRHPDHAALRSDRSTTGSEGPFPAAAAAGRTAPTRRSPGHEAATPTSRRQRKRGDASPPPSPRAARDAGDPLGRRRGWMDRE